MDEAKEEMIEDSRKAGIEAYRNKDYQTALQHFDSAMETLEEARCPQYPGLYELLNLRAATFEKMDKLGEAAKEAKRMIKLDKMGAEGYLRAGKVMCLMGKWETALEVCRSGLGRVPHEHPQRSALVGQCEKIAAKVKARDVEKKKRDPFAALPLELINMVFSLLDFRSIIRSQQVCKSWWDFLRNQYSQTFRILDFSDTLIMPKIATIASYIKLSGTPGRDPVEEIILPLLEQSISLLQRVIICCPTLHTVRITDGPLWVELDTTVLGNRLQTVVLDCPVFLDGIVSLLSQCSRLKTLESLSTYWSGRRLGEKHWFEVQNESLEHIFLGCSYHPLGYENTHIAMELQEVWAQCMPNLRSIRLEKWEFRHVIPDSWDFRSFQHLTHFTIRDVNWGKAPLLPPTVTHLTLIPYSRELQIPTLIDQILAFPLPNLTHLDLSNSISINNHVISAYLSGLARPSPLRNLNISGCIRVDASELSWLLDSGHCDYLEKLRLAGLATFDDQVTREMGRLKWLKGIDLSQTKITGAGLMNVVNGIGRERAKELGREKGLDWVKLEQCEWVGLDAIELARKLGVKVSYRSQNSKDLKAKKVIFR